jgi:hypothetical protein
MIEKMNVAVLVVKQKLSHYLREKEMVFDISFQKCKENYFPKSSKHSHYYFFGLNQITSSLNSIAGTCYVMSGSDLSYMIQKESELGDIVHLHKPHGSPTMDLQSSSYYSL